ncbi:hypothetical protein AGMMS49579_01250 [Spirochaetia bacterium]|nr:hypothetical protein AGMMS49579_01250 [Spirochaetia bacterium]
MNNPTYKKIDTISRLLEDMWSLFPNIITDQDINIQRGIITPMINRSVEYCDLLNKNIIKVQVFAKGGFGIVGDVFMDEDSTNQPLLGIIISTKRQGGFETFYVPVIVKIYQTETQPTWFISKLHVNLNIKGLFISDPLSEMVFGGMLGHLYDLGICPFFTKYFGSYICKTTRKMSIITEKATYELKYLLSRNNTKNILKHPLIFINLLFQYIYTLYIMKIYYGMIHFDTNPRNIMVKVINNSTLLENAEDYIYQGENISKKPYFLFQTPYFDKNNQKVPLFICIKNTGLLLKLIDYGVCASFFDRSVFSNFKKGISISSALTDFKLINATNAFEHSVFLNTTSETLAYSNTVDFMFTFNNVWEHLYKGLDISAYTEKIDQTAVVENNEILNIFNTFTINFMGKSIMEHLNENPNQQVLKQNGKYAWLSFNHDVGLTDIKFASPLSLLKNLLNCCPFSKILNLNFIENNFDNVKAKVFYFEPNLLHIDTLTNDNCMLLTNTSTEYIKKFNQFNSWIKASNALETCKVNCNNLMSEKLKNSYKHLTQKKLFNPTPLIISKDNEVIKNILYTYYHIQGNPKAKNLPRNEKGSLVYQTYQNWINLKPVPGYKSGKYIEFINIHIFKFNTIKNINLEINTDLWTGIIKNASAGLATNGGYYITQQSVNKFYPYLKDKVNNPVGFFYKKGQLSGTILSFPDTYNDDLAAIYGTFNGSIFVESWKKFKSRHRLITDFVTYETVETKKIIKVPVEAISMDNNLLIGNTPNVISKTDEYDFAFVTGPILLSQNNIVFTESRMNNELNILNNNILAIIPNTQTPYKFKSDSSENNQIYSMRSSNNFMAHNIFAVDKRGNYCLILVEGKGFDSPGIDRAQLSILLKQLNMDAAISLSGDFNANIIYKDCMTCTPLFTLNNPDKRILGTSLYFS